MSKIRHLTIAGTREPLTLEEKRERQDVRKSRAQEIAEYNARSAGDYWYVVSMNDIVATEVSLDLAKKACIASCLDTRKRPPFKRVNNQSNLYQYQSIRALTSHRKSYLIGTKQALESYGIRLEDLGCMEGNHDETAF